MAESKPIVGTEFKIQVSIDPVDSIPMSGMEFTCMFYTSMDKPYIVEKSQMIKVDDSNYIALVDTAEMNAGSLRNRITVDIPDSDFSDGYRKEIKDVDTGIKLYK